MDKSPYEVLGVSETASADEVKKAYRKKARQYHPDVNPNDPEAAKRMNEVNEAYDMIVNPEKYTRRRPPSSSGYGGSAYSGGSQGGTGGGYSGYSGGYGGYSGGGYSGGYGNGQSQGGQGSQRGGAYGYGWPFDDIFGGGWAGTTTTVNIHPEVSINDSSEIQQAINLINNNMHKQAVTILSAIPSTGRNARWYYLSALAHNGAGNTLTALEQISKAVRMEPNNMTYAQVQRTFQQAGERYTQQTQSQGFTMSSANPASLCCACCMAQYAIRLCLGMM